MEVFQLWMLPAKHQGRVTCDFGWQLFCCDAGFDCCVLTQGLHAAAAERTGLVACFRGSVVVVSPFRETRQTQAPSLKSTPQTPCMYACKCSSSVCISCCCSSTAVVGAHTACGCKAMNTAHCSLSHATHASPFVTPTGVDTWGHCSHV